MEPLPHRFFSKALRPWLWLASASFMLGLFVLFTQLTQAAPDDAFAEHGKHLPWTAGDIFALTSGYNEDYHVTANTKYLLDFAKRFPDGVPDQQGTKSQAILAIGDGTVTQIVTQGYNGGLGRYVKVDHGQGYMTRYDHIGWVNPDLHVGDQIARGMKIGEIGDTGFSIGYHMQVSLWKDGVIVPMEHLMEVQGMNVTTGETPITSFFGKTNHFFFSNNQHVKAINLAKMPK